MRERTPEGQPCNRITVKSAEDTAERKDEAAANGCDSTGTTAPRPRCRMGRQAQAHCKSETADPITEHQASRRREEEVRASDAPSLGRRVRRR